MFNKKRRHETFNKSKLVIVGRFEFEYIGYNLGGNNVLYDGFLDLSLMKISPLC